MTRQPSKHELAQVRAAFDPDMLKHLCVTWDFSHYATKTQLGADPDRFYWYQDNGSDILAVAHLDTVQDDRTCQVIDTAAGLLAVSGGLDDRLGVYVILDLLPKLGLTFDILLTTDEERGMTTATEFNEDFRDGGKQYNHIIEFDRGGTDVVMYDYETPEYAAMVEDAGAQVGIGIYSDICELEDLGCAAFNWGVGYEEYHSPKSHAWLNDTFRMVGRYLNFHRLYGMEHLPHENTEQLTFDDVDDADWVHYRDMDQEDLNWMRGIPSPSSSRWTEEVDCGHSVDLGDAQTFTEWANGDYIICRACEVKLS
jgi:hypothetical protein